jgi:hypothetical protein
LPGAAALVALSCGISGVSVLSAYPAYLLNLNRAADVGFVTAQSMPNLRGLLTAFLGRAPYPGRIHWLLLPVAVAAIVLAARIWRRLMHKGFSGFELGYCMALPVAILTSYYTYSYDMALLVVPLLLLGGGFLELHTMDRTGMDQAGIDQNMDQAGLPPFSRRMIAAGLLLLIFTPMYWALILRLDSSYLLVVPMLILVIGIGSVIRQPLPSTT